MKQARLYDNPQEFAGMMMKHLSESLNVSIQQNKEEPLLLEMILNQGKENERMEVSLHSTMQTYMASGDLNTAIDYLNGVVDCTIGIRMNQGLAKLDPQYIYPAIRDNRYIEEAGLQSTFLSEEYLPGLGVIFIETKDTFSKIINQSLLEQNPRFTEERVKRLAYKNLQYSGWNDSRMSLKSPFRSSCYVEVFTDNDYPVECQFLLPEMSRNHMPESCLVAYTNRKTSLLLRSDEKMGTMSDACFLAGKSRFKEVVKRSYRNLPQPVSDQIYWIHKGKAQLLEEA